MIFLDSNIISYYFNGDIKVKGKILETIDNGENICTTVINIYEILKGFRWKNNKKKENQFKELDLFDNPVGCRTSLAKYSVFCCFL